MTEDRLSNVDDLDRYNQIVLRLQCSMCDEIESMGWYVPSDLIIKDHEVRTYCENCDKQTKWEQA